MRFALILTFLASTAVAQPMQPELICTGTNPTWSFRTTTNSATFTLDVPSTLTVQLITQTEGADWPRAYTFTGRGDSAIVIVEPASHDQIHPVRILTQRGETPLLLIGTCDLS